MVRRPVLAPARVCQLGALQGCNQWEDTAGSDNCLRSIAVTHSQSMQHCSAGTLNGRAAVIQQPDDPTQQGVAQQRCQQRRGRITHTLCDALKQGGSCITGAARHHGRERWRKSASVLQQWGERAWARSWGTCTHTHTTPANGVVVPRQHGAAPALEQGHKGPNGATRAQAVGSDDPSKVGRGVAQ